MTPECPMPPRGWRCIRPFQHEGPCAAVPRWWNIVARLRYGRSIR